MIKHAGMFDARTSSISPFSSSANLELAWRSWQHQETQNRYVPTRFPEEKKGLDTDDLLHVRLAYNWVMVDQELSLFHDTAPMLAVSELTASLPGSELLWMSTDADQWMNSMQSICSGGTPTVNWQLLTTRSLFDLFQDFLHDNLGWRQGSLTPQQLRLLLHPLQSLLCHLRQMLSCFSDVLSPRPSSSRTVSKASTMQRLEEVQTLLQKWYELTIGYLAEHPGCAVSKTNLVLYHLISLNAVTNFTEIERLARREAFNVDWNLSQRHKRCIYQREESIFHCGQVMRLVRAMPVDRRPSWWSAAVYRAALILWTDGVVRLDPDFQKRDESGDAVPIDQVKPEDTAIISYLWRSQGVPVLSCRDGSAIGLDKPAETLSYAVKILEDGISSRFSDGIRRKLIALENNWSAAELNGTVAGPSALATATAAATST